MSKDAPGVRFAEIERETAETRVHMVLDLDGGSRHDVGTGIGFFDHMLTLLAFHGQIDLGVSAVGDLEVDDHHLVEDVGIVMGQALREALVSEQNITRYGSVQSPMDEALVLVVIDVSGRGVLTWNVDFQREKLGELSTECIREFFRALAAHSRMTIHVHKTCGLNDHHVAEAIFKGFGRALHLAAEPVDRRVPSTTKGLRD